MLAPSSLGGRGHTAHDVSGASDCSARRRCSRLRAVFLRAVGDVTDCRVAADGACRGACGGCDRSFGSSCNDRCRSSGHRPACGRRVGCRRLARELIEQERRTGAPPDWCQASRAAGAPCHVRDSGGLHRAAVTFTPGSGRAPPELTGAAKGRNHAVRDPIDLAGEIQLFWAIRPLEPFEAPRYRFPSSASAFVGGSWSAV